MLARVILLLSSENGWIPLERAAKGLDPNFSPFDSDVCYRQSTVQDVKNIQIIWKFGRIYKLWDYTEMHMVIWQYTTAAIVTLIIPLQLMDIFYTSEKNFCLK